jgi:hypothetical protein
MAYRIILTNAVATNTIDEVRRAFTQLNIGEIETIDSYYEERKMRTIRTFSIQFASVADNLFAKQFYERLVFNDAKQREGDKRIVVPRIIYGTWRDGTDMIWYAHLGSLSEVGVPLTNVKVEM